VKTDWSDKYNAPFEAKKYGMTTHKAKVMVAKGKRGQRNME